MSAYQYAIPFLLPPPQEDNSYKSVLLHYALRSLTKTFSYGSKIVNKPLLDVEAPIVVCISMGHESSWKSRLINKMPSPQQETFWHQGLRGGDCKQIISEGLVEITWYLPGKNQDKIFQYPVTFLNVRQNFRTCDALYNLPSVLCIFVENVNEDLCNFLGEQN